MSDKQLLLKGGVQMYRNICNKSGYMFFPPPSPHLLIKMTQMLMTAFTTGGTGRWDMTRN